MQELHVKPNACNSRMSVCFLTHTTCKKVTQIIYLGPLPTSEIQNIQTFHPLFLESVPKAFKVTAIVSNV